MNKFISPYPISLYVTFGVFVIFNLHNFDEVANITLVCLYSAMIATIFYYVFGRYAAKIIICNNYIRVKYFFLWNKEVNIDLKDVQGITVKKSFYDYFSDNTIAGIFVFPRYCYDLMEIYYKNGNQKKVKINTMILHFDKIIILVNLRLKNN